MDWKRIVMGLASAVLAASQAWAAATTGEVTVSVAPEREKLAKSDNVMVSVTVSNGTAATQYLLKWQTPFAPVEAPLFDVTRDGQPVPYLGRQVKRPAPAAADYIALKPGASRSVRIELSALYDMSVTGAYSVRWRPDVTRLFSRPGAARSEMSVTGALVAATAKSAPQPAAIWIEGRVQRGSLPPQARNQGVLEPAGLSYARCSNAQQDAIGGAVQAAQAMAADADAYLQQTALGTRYTGWFGAIDAERGATVVKHFQAIKDAFATKPVTVDCGCNESYYAYVYPNQPYKIYVCKAFWSAPVTGTDSKGGTLVHEMSHFTVVAGTNDWVYGQSGAAQLAASDPAKAIDNADSHEYFGENNPARQ